MLLACVRASAGASVLRPKKWGRTALCGLLFFVGCHGVLAHAQQQVPSGLAAIMLATIPFFGSRCCPYLCQAGSAQADFTLSLLVPGLLGVALIAWHDVGSSGLRWLGHRTAAGVPQRRGPWARSCPIPTLTRLLPWRFLGWELIFGGTALLIIGTALGEWHSLDLASISGASLIACGAI